MNLNDNSNHFLNKLCDNLNISIEQGIEMLKERINGNKICEIQNGKISSINIRGLAHAKSSMLKKIGIREPVKIMDASEIDLSDLHDLVQLDFLSRVNNEAAVPQYDFAHHPHLESLVFRLHRQTNSINISECAELREIDCSTNNLDALDTSNNLKLQKLNCQINPLKSLNLSKNSALTYLLANGTNLTEEELIFPKENRISALHLRATKINRINLVSF